MAIPAEWTLADLVEHLGGIPLHRIPVFPPPGMATEKDVLESKPKYGRICELLDGVLVAKPLSFQKALLGTRIVSALGGYVERHNLGICLGATGTLKILPDQVRIPDVCFISWDRFPNRQLPPEPIPALAPDLAVEVLSEGNTEREMERKLRDYFAAGVRLVWYIDPKTRSARVYTAPERCELVDESGVLPGGDVLPGFELPMKELFAHVEGRRPA